MKSSKRDRFIELISGKEIHAIIGIGILTLVIIATLKW